MRTPPELTPEDTVAEFKAWLSKPGNGDAPCTCGEKLADHYADLSGCAGNVECKGFNLDWDRVPAPPRPAITQTEINRAVSHVLPEGTADLAALQVVMLGPDVVEVKARRADDGDWYQGTVHRRHWADEPSRGMGAEADPRIPGIQASIEFMSGCVDRRGNTEVGRELFHCLKEMEAWLQSILDGDEDE